MKKRNRLAAVIVVAIVFTLAFIFYNSTKSQEASGNMSSSLYEILKPVLSFIFGEDNASELLLRKLGHFCEFALLGGEVFLLIVIRFRLCVQNAVNACFFGFICGATDETIQIFSLRGSQLQDVWLDFAGYLFGFSLLAGVHTLVKRIKSKKVE